MLQTPLTDFFKTPTNTVKKIRPIRALLADKSKSSKEYFEKLQLEISEYIEKLEEKTTLLFSDLLILVDKSLLLLELDVYFPSTVLRKDAILKRTCQFIDYYLDYLPIVPSEIVELLDLLSRNNFEASYDYNWLSEEKMNLFRDIIMKLYEKFYDFLKIEIEQKNINKLVSIEMIAIVISAISVWRLVFRGNFAEDAIRTMEARFKSGEALSEELAFRFLNGIVERVSFELPAKDSLKLRKNKLRSEMFTAFLQQASLLLLADELPLQMDTIERVVLLKLTRLIELLFFIGGARDKRNPCGSILFKLQEKCERLRFLTPNRIGGKYHAGQREYKHMHFSLDFNVWCINRLIKHNNPKGLQWYMARCSREVVEHLKSGFTYYIEDITDFLKIFRRCVWDINVAIITEAVIVLVKEAVSDLHIQEVTFALAIDLLWINMIFSTLMPDKNIAYSNDEQKKLFEKIQDNKINEEQARALFEIRTLKWCGEASFSASILDQMETYHETFSNSVNSSKEEKSYFAKIYSILPDAQKEFLKMNYICRETGHEIDIAYLGELKIAIHIDGPFHFDPITKEPDHRTRFRNLCLSKANWKSLEINITDPIKEAAAFASIISEFDKLFNSKPQTNSINEHISEISTAAYPSLP